MRLISVLCLIFAILQSGAHSFPEPAGDDDHVDSDYFDELDFGRVKRVKVSPLRWGRRIIANGGAAASGGGYSSLDLGPFFAELGIKNPFIYARSGNCDAIVDFIELDQGLGELIHLKVTQDETSAYILFKRLDPQGARNVLLFLGMISSDLNKYRESTHQAVEAAAGRRLVVTSRIALLVAVLRGNGTG